MRTTLWTTPSTPVSCRAMASLKRLTFTGLPPPSHLNLILSSTHVDVLASTATDPHRNKHLDTTTTHNHDADSTCQPARHDSLTLRTSRLTILITSLPAPLLGTTASINDHPPPPCRRQLARRLPHHRSAERQYRPPRDASMGRLPGASVASNL